jgi:hypothetical protein
MLLLFLLSLSPFPWWLKVAVMVVRHVVVVSSLTVGVKQLRNPSHRPIVLKSRAITGNAGKSERYLLPWYKNESYK